MRKLVFAFIASIAISGCVIDPPQRDYALARAAVDAAREADAARFASGYWHSAEDAFRKAERLYKDKEHEKAKEMFRRARIYAERAENAAQLKRAKGDGY